MSQYQSFFVNAFGDSSQCEDLNHFLRSHVVIRTVENLVSTGANCGIQILVEYKDIQPSDTKSSKRVDYRSLLKTDEEKSVFDKLKAFRANLAKEKKLVGAYMVCKDEHLAAIVQNPKITAEEIKSLPHSNNIMLKDFADAIFAEYQKILSEKSNTENQENPINQNQNEENVIPF